MFYRIKRVHTEWNYAGKFQKAKQKNVDNNSLFDVLNSKCFKVNSPLEVMKPTRMFRNDERERAKRNEKKRMHQ